MALNLAPFRRWTLREKAVLRRLLPAIRRALSLSAMYSADATLISQIRACVRSLPSQSNEMAAELSKFADDIEAPATREIALQQFDDYARHYKGLRDRIVPGIEQNDWTKKVGALSRQAGAAMKARKPPAWWQRWFRL